MAEKTFAMITTRASSAYTPVALRSFFAHTSLNEGDRFFLIDNDQTFQAKELAPFPRVELITNRTPKSFAANVNSILQIARAASSDLYFLNNDLVFTPQWLEPLVVDQPIILSPTSNREFQYLKDSFRCERALALEDFLGQEQKFETIATFHRSTKQGYRTTISIPFFCIKLPFEVYSVVGDLDESFGKGGAEDNDYCLRAYLAGFRVAYALNSYVLHFSGRSTWNGAENDAERISREQKYLKVFGDKWGEKLLRYVITFDQSVIADDQVAAAAAQRGEFKSLIEHLRPVRSLA